MFASRGLVADSGIMTYIFFTVKSRYQDHYNKDHFTRKSSFFFSPKWLLPYNFIFSNKTTPLIGPVLAFRKVVVIKEFNCL